MDNKEFQKKTIKVTYYKDTTYSNFKKNCNFFLLLKLYTLF